MTPTENIGTIGTATESYSKGVATVNVQLTFPPNKYGITGSLSLPLSINLATAITAAAADTGKASAEEVASFVSMALGAV